jgi:acyl-CoA oxidase
MSREQQEVWIPKTQVYEISGCFAQTELGHGSNVSGIETTATFAPATDEFILHSPTTSSHKYWIGSLGVLATHALVVARLIIFGKDLGNHVFLVQVRDLSTHELVPNVLIYEQGQKSLGSFASVDNGTMQFTQKRIPRCQMLAGMASVDRDGSYHASQNTKHSYTSMVIIRGLMIAEIGQDVAKAVIIALRYTAFRRQFNADNGLEMPVLNYASVKNRLYPALCRVS